MFTPDVNRVLINYFFLSFLEMANLVIVTLMYSTPMDLGGLGLEPFGIGLAMGLYGFFNSLFQVRFLGGFIRKYGAKKLYVLTFPGLLGCFGMYPVLNFLAQRSHGVSWVVIAGMVVQFACRSLITMSFGKFEPG